jgi:hypothetical protein
VRLRPCSTAARGVVNQPRSAIRLRAAQHVEVTHHDSEQVVEVVGDAAR